MTIGTRSVLQRFFTRLLITAAAFIGLIFAVLGCAVLIVLADSPQRCPSTMGCTERKDQGCTSWRGLLEPAWDSGPCYRR
jgi:hypothetical protein